MNRRKARLLLADYVNESLPEKEMKRLEGLLRSDAVLREEVDSIRCEMAVVRGALGDPLEEQRLRKITSDVLREIPKIKKSFWLAPSFLFPAGAVVLTAAAAVVFGLVFFVQPQTDPSSSPVPEQPQMAAEIPGKIDDDGPETGADTIPMREKAEQQETEPIVRTPEDKPGKIKMSFATKDPKVKIYWTFSRDFEPNVIGE